MRISDLGARALGVLGAITLLAGCGGGASGGVAPLPLGGPFPNGGSPSQVARPPINGHRQAEAQNLTANEVLTASGRNVNVVLTHGGGKGVVIEGATFSAQGKAVGRYRGIFTARGEWNEAFVQPMEWSFEEAFTITTATKKIYGSVNGKGYCLTLVNCGWDAANALDYDVDGALGKATIKLSAGHFREVLVGLGAGLGPS
jgi:hypothetical protein